MTNPATCRHKWESAGPTEPNWAVCKKCKDKYTWIGLLLAASDTIAERDEEIDTLKMSVVRERRATERALRSKCRGCVEDTHGPDGTAPHTCAAADLA